MLQYGESHGQHFAIAVLGPIVVMRDGIRRALPSSRKTRGLLAYLALAPRACRREDLCDLLWEGAADPRSELRWSLAKIRAAVGPWLQVSSGGVGLAGETLSIDAVAFREMAREALSEQRIADALAIWRGLPLADAEVNGQHAFQAWLAAERDSLAGLHTRLLKAAVDRAWARPEEALSAARRLVAHEPWSEWGHARVVQSLERCGRLTEAAAYGAVTRQSLSRELGIPEAQVLAESPPPPPPAGCAGSNRPQAPRRVPRCVIQLQPLKLVPPGDDFARLAAQVTASLGLGLWRSRSCDLLDAEWSAQSNPGDCLEADFVVRGAVVRWGGAVQLSLRCVDLRLGKVVWFGQLGPGWPAARTLSRWVDGVVDAIGAATRVASPGAGDTGDLPNRLLTARSLAGALQPAANRQAVDVLNAILAEDADEPNALSLAAWCYAQRAVYNWSTNPDQDRGEARRFAAAATQIGIEDPESLTTIAAARTLVADQNGAEALLDQALRLDPRAAGAHVRRGWLANYLDDPARAARHFRMAMRLAPFDAAYFNCLAGLGVAHFIQGDHIQAIRRMEQALALSPKAVWIYRNLVPAYVAAGDRQKAGDGICMLVKDHPQLTVAAVCDALGRPSACLIGWLRRSRRSDRAGRPRCLPAGSHRAAEAGRGAERGLNVAGSTWPMPRGCRFIRAKLVRHDRAIGHGRFTLVSICACGQMRSLAQLLVVQRPQ
jgi:DNA-binding SARP family transcriptional activator/tetratricopeptide (TPR) repeat protein